GRRAKIALRRESVREAAVLALHRPQIVERRAQRVVRFLRARAAADRQRQPGNYQPRNQSPYHSLLLLLLTRKETKNAFQGRRNRFKLEACTTPNPREMFSGMVSGGYPGSASAQGTGTTVAGQRRTLTGFPLLDRRIRADDHLKRSYSVVVKNIPACAADCQLSLRLQRRERHYKRDR